MEEFGHVKGEQEMMAEIYARGPIACHLNSEAMAFDMYKGGIITCPIDECKKPWYLLHNAFLNYFSS